MLFESQPEHNIRLEILSPLLCKLSVINESLPNKGTGNVNMMLKIYVRGERSEGSDDSIRFTFTLYQEQGYILVQGDLENFIFSLKTIGYIDESLYQTINRYLFSLFQRMNSIPHDFSPARKQQMDEEYQRLVTAFYQGNVRVATIHFFNIGAMSGII